MHYGFFGDKNCHIHDLALKIRYFYLDKVKKTYTTLWH
jgi:hypothetical protein